MYIIKIQNIEASPRGGLEGADLASAAQEFVEAMGERKVFAFYGKMGAGKTTFIKAICEALDVEDVVTSPTFAIVNEYKAPSGSVYHFDFYRIKNLREAYDIGCEEYFYSGQPCFIEWPELIEELLPDDAVRVNIEVHDDGSRTVRLD
ncbi:MAG: tRNA (adenosine(37)-N6)-threonylcarbamoyltransferase complex ATPase subunit type 1 TsaE [Bacteroidaceae bacterium]|nr:tRNA (adenosine(37)-N6)-threonylcarbamoyltransferase complex ATPase subunit type 1 TsaE [Bacteroidaceae bacterium]